MKEKKKVKWRERERERERAMASFNRLAISHSLSSSSPLESGLVQLFVSSKSKCQNLSWSNLQIRCDILPDNGSNIRYSYASRRKALIASTILGIVGVNNAEAVSTSRRALRSEQIPESEYKSLPNGLKYYDLKVGGGSEASKGSRVAIHYVAKWKGVTFMTSRQGMGVTGGTPYGFDVGASKYGQVLKGLDLGVQGMRVGGQRLLLVPPELAYGDKGIQEIPPNATLEFNIELLSIKQSPFGSPVKLVEG